MAFDLSGGYGAGAGADMLQQILKQKAMEFAQAEQIRMAEQRLKEDARQADQSTGTTMRGQDFGREASQGNLSLGRDTLGQRQTEFDAEAPQRDANVALTGAQTGNILRQPEKEQADRDFTTGRDTAERDFTTGRDKTLNQYELGQIGAQGNQQMRLQGARMAGSTAPTAPNTEQKNEMIDALGIVEGLLSNPALPRAVGPLDQFGAGYATNPLGSGELTNFIAKQDQLKNILSLAQAGKLKGQGQVTESERAMLAKAATALNRGTNEKAYTQELRNIQDYFKRKQDGEVRPLAPGAAPDKIGRFEIIR